VRGKGVKSNVAMMMSDSHFTPVRFQVTGGRHTCHMKNSNFVSFMGTIGATRLKYKSKIYMTGTIIAEAT